MNDLPSARGSSRNRNVAAYRPSISDHAFQSARDRRKRAAGRRELRRELLSAGDLDRPPADHAAQPFARALADLAGLLKSQSRRGCGGDDRRRERMARVSLQARHRGQHFARVDIVRGEDLGQLRLPVGQRAGLVEDGGAAGVDLFQHGRVLDDDAAPGGQGDRADDRDGDGDQQRARRRHDQHGEKSQRRRRSTPTPERAWRRPAACRRRRADRPAAAAAAGAAPIAHDLHDLGVPGIDRRLLGADRQGAVAVDRPGQHRRPGRLGHEVRLAGQIRFVHGAVPFDHDAVDRAGLVREDDQRIADRYLVERDVIDAAALSSGGRRRASGAPAPRARTTLDGPRTPPGLPAGEHQHDERPREVFAEHHRGDDRDAREQIGAELEA